MRNFLDASTSSPLRIPRGRVRDFLAVLLREDECVTNAYAAEEARHNLELKSPGSLRAFEALIKRCELIPAIVADFDVSLPAKDLPILGGAIAGQATHLLTSDQQDFGDYFGKTLQGVKVVSPRMLAEELIRHGRL